MAGGRVLSSHHSLEIMNDYLMTLGFASLPVLSNIIGGMLAEILPISRRTIGLALHVAVGVLLAIARVIAHIPLGFATLAEFKRHKTSRSLRLGLIISFIVPMLVGAILSYWVLRGQVEIFKLAILAFTTGILITAVVEEIIPEAHKTQDIPLSNLFFIGSFAAFAIFLTYIA